MLRMKILIIGVLISMSFMAFGDVVNVPADFATIQAAIDDAGTVNGDTVLVAEGLYTENIDFSGKDIVIASLYISDYTSTHIDNTIINGSASGPVVKFENSETMAAKLIGFSITNGSNVNGAGIYCNDATPSLKNLKIYANTATSSGGGIYLYDSDARLDSLVINDNASPGDGAGLSCYNSDPLVTRTLFYGNLSSSNGGAISAYNGSDISLRHVTVTENYANYDGSGIACLWNSTVTILNSIVYNNGVNGMFQSGSGEINATYSDLQDGSGEPWYGQGCINLDPMFKDIENSDYTLELNSPCIDAGDPDGIYNDPDGTTADMGVYCVTQAGIRGSIYVNGGTGTVEEVVIEISGDTTLSFSPNVVPDVDGEGEYFILLVPGDYVINASLSGYMTDPEDGYEITLLEGQLVSGRNFDLNLVEPGQIKGRVSLNGLGTVTDVTITAGDVSVHPYYNEISGGYHYLIEIADGTYDVTASLPGYLDSTVTDVRVYHNQITDNINFILELIKYDGYVTGTVSLYGGTGDIEDVKVTDGIDTTTVDASGEYLLKSEEGIQDITAFLTGYTSITQPGINIHPGDTTRNVDFTLLPWQTITGTSYNMIVYATVSYDGNFVYGTNNNILAAFGPGGDSDCRGYGTWIEGNHPYWNTETADSLYYDIPGYYFLTVVSDVSSGAEDISFKFYNAKVDTVINALDSIQFINYSYDNVINMELPSPNHTIDFSLDLNWNWISFNLQAENTLIDSVFDDLTTTNNTVQVKHDSLSNTYFAPNWQGPGAEITNITNGEGYLIRLYDNEVDPFQFTGTRINPVVNVIKLSIAGGGYNWIGYYPIAPMAIATALESVEGADTLIIKNQTQSAINVAGDWIGDLTMLEPGIGYKFKVVASTDKFLQYKQKNTSMKATPENQVLKNNFADWTLLENTSTNMIALVVPKISGKCIDDGENYSIGIFDANDNCRSIGFAKDNFWYFTVVGNGDNESLYFKIIDSNKNEYFSNESILFKSNEIIGDVSDPIEITFCKPTNINDNLVLNSFSLEQNYPNPFNPHTKISYSIPKKGHVELTVYDLKGKKIETLVNSYQNANHFEVIWNAQEYSSGVYFYKLTLDSQSTLIRRCLLIK